MGARSTLGFANILVSRATGALAGKIPLIGKRALLLNCFISSHVLITSDYIDMIAMRGNIRLRSAVLVPLYLHPSRRCRLQGTTARPANARRTQCPDWVYNYENYCTHWP